MSCESDQTQIRVPPEGKTNLCHPSTRLEVEQKPNRATDSAAGLVFRLVHVRRNLLDDKTPTLAIIDQLLRAGWRRGQAPALHDADSPRFFGVDKLAARKRYLQCLAVQDRLLQRGLVALSSRETQLYYRAVLASDRPASVPCGGKAKDYKAILLALEDSPGSALAAIGDGAADSEGSDSGQSAVMVGRWPPPRREEDMPPGNEASAGLPPSVPRPGPARGGAGDVIPPGSSRPDAVSVPGPPSVAALASYDSDDDSPVFCAGAQMQAVGPPRPPVNECIRVEEHLRPGLPGYYRRYTTVCPLARTQHCAVFTCGKARNCGSAQMGNLGPAAPEAFLMVWREKASAFATKAAHQRWSPTWREVRRYMLAHGWAVGQ